MNSLFRREAVEHRGTRLTGEVLIVLPLPARVLVAFLSLAALLVALFLTFGSFARTETARGYLEPRSGISQIFVPVSGRVGEVHVREGDRIEIGKPLVTVSIEQFLTNGQRTEALISTELSRLLREVDRKITLAQRDHDSEVARLTAQLGNLRAEEKLMQEQIRLARQKVEILEEQLSRTEVLASRRHVSEIEILDRRNAFYSAQFNLEQYSQLSLQLESRLAEAEAHLRRLPLQLQQQKSDLEAQRTELVLRQTELAVGSTYSLVAPISGRVSGVYTKGGQHIDENALAISILPEGSELQAILYVPTRAIGFVEEGQVVRIFYDAFPHERFGVHSGLVSSISRTVLTGTEVRIPISLAEPAYKITVDIHQQSIDAFGRSYPLQAGIQLSAEVVLDERSILEWILEPLYAVKGHM